MITIIAAIDENNAIGKNGQLPWHLPKDLKHFKALTINQPIIMGRKTFESIGKALPKRTNIVLSSHLSFNDPSIIQAFSLEEALQKAEKFLNHEDKSSIFIIGGGEIYKQAFPFCDKLEITKVHTKIADADTFFPAFDLEDWDLGYMEKHKIDEFHSYNFDFLTYIKK